MRKSSKKPVTGEPIGIVISEGTRDEVPPRFLAYIWGPAPEDLTEPKAA